MFPPTFLFQSTPSVGRATFFEKQKHPAETISIHALRGEGDQIPLPMFVRRSLFQSTPSVGRATTFTATKRYRKIFQSTPSVGRATFTALTAGQGKFTFQSTPSVGRATQLLGYQYHCLVFQSTPSVGRATYRGRDYLYRLNEYFNPRPPWGGRQSALVFSSL